jgi:hypothetical protein
MTPTNSPAHLSRRVLLGALAVLPILIPPLCLPSPSANAQTEQLPSWNDGPAKTSIIDFVRRVTSPGGPDYVAPVERVAVFDNDGTLWVEQPTAGAGRPSPPDDGTTGGSAVPMNGYPKIFNIEPDQREEHNIGAM